MKTMRKISRGFVVFYAVVALVFAGYGQDQEGYRQGNEIYGQGQESDRQDQAGWVIEARERANYTGVTLANGRIGLMPSHRPFEVSSIVLNNVYDKESPTGVSRVLKGINFANLEMRIDGELVDSTSITGWKQVLHMREAYLETSFLFVGKKVYKGKSSIGSTGGMDGNIDAGSVGDNKGVDAKAEIRYRIYALRNMPYVGVMQVWVKALNGEMKVAVAGKVICEPEYPVLHADMHSTREGDIEMPLMYTVAQSPFGRHTLATTASFIFEETQNKGRPPVQGKAVDLGQSKGERSDGYHSVAPVVVHRVVSEREQVMEFEKEIGKDEGYEFGWAGAVCSSADFGDPLSESERMVLYLMRGDLKQAIEGHRLLWEELWQGDIEVEGDRKAQEDQLDIRLALYHLYSFARSGSDLSVAPMGLSSQGYNGHIFWDAELWMYPPLLVLNRDIATSMLNYRFDRLETAKVRAMNYGYRGVYYPWESDDTGEEATPVWALTGPFEQHITADVGIACWNYFRVTQDTSWLRQRGYPLMRQAADFWVSRAEKNADGSWSVRHVIGADENAAVVNDNAFTNGSAKAILQYTLKASAILGETPEPSWAEVADHLLFRYTDDGVMLEHENYKGEVVKQADVNLLAYPLELVTREEQIRADLTYYEQRMWKEGPAMGNCILSLLYSRLGDRVKAYDLFRKCYEPNKRPPFGTLSETAHQNNPYFATGAGGMLQTVIFGFGGLRITDEGVKQMYGCLPKEWKKLTIRGIGPRREVFVIEH